MLAVQDILIKLIFWFQRLKQVKKFFKELKIEQKSTWWVYLCAESIPRKVSSEIVNIFVKINFIKKIGFLVVAIIHLDNLTNITLRFDKIENALINIHKEVFY